jgi:serine/threonine protein phosphatase PrpC
MSEQASSDAVPQRHLAVRAVLRTDVGLVRSENQDFGTYTTTAEESSSHPGGRLLIVADGMGGHRGGATASRLAGETVKMQYLDSETSDIPTALRESLSRANARIFSEAQSNPELRGMGTTTSVLAVRDHHGWLAHVGDSRIYLVRNGEIKQLTDDHSLVATMVREGLLTSAEAETHPRRNVLQRSMGVAEDVEIDVRGPFELREGDTFILCSDGLHGVVKEHELLEISAGTIEEAADEFLRRALERGAPDNVTVIVARVEATDEAPVFVPRDEDTQPLEPPDPAPFDETVKETQKLKAVTPEELREDLRVTDKITAVLDDTIPMGGRNIHEQRAAVSAQPAKGKSKPALRWALVVVLALGAAGAWFYWNHQQAVTSPAR